MSDNLQQIHCDYSAEQDRVLLEISSDGRKAYRVWLTRRFVVALWRALMKAIENIPDIQVQPETTAKRAVMTFQKDEAVQSTDFSKQYDKTDLTYPLGEEPILPTRITCTSGKGNVTRLTMKAVDGKAVNFNLNQQLVYSFCHLLITVTGKANWGLGLRIGDGQAVAAGDKTKVH